MIQSLFILTLNGEVLIEKHWRKVTARQYVDVFMAEISNHDLPEDIHPVIESNGMYLVNVFRNKLFVLCAIAEEISPLMVTEFVNRVIATFCEYFSSFDEASIKDNFATVYQLLEELCDNGYPSITESNSLKEMVAPPSISNMIASAVAGKSSVSDVLPDAVVSNIPWRRQGVYYNMNVIYFDVIEYLDCIIGRNGDVLCSNVTGELHALSKLSGMPDILITLEKGWSIEDYSLHPCIRISRFEKERILSFVPPDGESMLMKYTLDKSCTSRENSRSISSLPIPISCQPQLMYDKHGGSIQCTLGPKVLGAYMSAMPMLEKVEEISLVIPFPHTVRSTDIKCSHGVVTSDEVSKVCTWKLGKLPKDGLATLTGSFAYSQDAPGPEESLTMVLEFKVPGFSVSNLSFASFHIVNESYTPYRYLRSIMKTGKVQFRL